MFCFAMACTYLFEKARELSSAVTTPPPPEPDLTSELVYAVVPIQQQLRKDLADALESAVMEAARLGKRHADVLTFHGNEKYNDTDYSYLFLIKGPRDREQRVDIFEHGFIPLFDSLSYDFLPFTLHFVWVPGANVNKLRVSW